MGKEMCYTCAVEYYSAIKKKENMPVATTGIDLEGVMLSEISQRKAHIVWSDLYVESKKKKKKTKTPRNRSDWCLPGTSR